MSKLCDQARRWVKAFDQKDTVKGGNVHSAAVASAKGKRIQSITATAMLRAYDAMTSHILDD